MSVSEASRGEDGESEGFGCLGVGVGGGGVWDLLHVMDLPVWHQCGFLESYQCHTLCPTFTLGQQTTTMQGSHVHYTFVITYNSVKHEMKTGNMVFSHVPHSSRIIYDTDVGWKSGQMKKYVTFTRKVRYQLIRVLCR